ncbi:hypothetical protein P879_06139 [Paragonimus westermani]|uniref:Uncharacterized protein n=1 Tax=Paragonimus westermani TaxID=34504 RepID=A0A8T0DP52_9TREM|nr:hypothetical protein P879_06139 [Paragonimus westermani]
MQTRVYWLRIPLGFPHPVKHILVCILGGSAVNNLFNWIYRLQTLWIYRKFDTLPTCEHATHNLFLCTGSSDNQPSLDLEEKNFELDRRTIQNITDPSSSSSL